MKQTKKSYSKIKFGLLFLALAFGLAACDAPPPATIDPDAIVADADCASYILTHGDNTVCNRVCLGSCILAGQSCEYNDPTTCIETPGMTLDEIAEHLDFYGVDFGPPDDAIPTLIRLGLTMIFSIMGFGSLAMGLYGLAIRSTAGENADKAKLAVAILSNALKGTVIGFMAVVITQVVATVAGMSGDIFEFNLVPSVVVINNITDPCEPGTTGYFQGGNRYYFCAANGIWDQREVKTITDPTSETCSPGELGVYTRLGVASTYTCSSTGIWVEDNPVN